LATELKTGFARHASLTQQGFPCPHGRAESTLSSGQDLLALFGGSVKAVEGEKREHDKTRTKQIALIMLDHGHPPHPNATRHSASLLSLVPLTPTRDVRPDA